MDNVPSENNSELRRLFKTVSVRKDAPDFFIIDNSTSADAGLIKQVSGMLDRASIKSASIDLAETPTVSDLLDRMKAYKAQGYDFLHVTGGDKWLSQYQPYNDGRATGVSILNIAREKMFEIKMMVAFYLSEKGISTLANESPDLWSWRGGIYKPHANPAQAQKPGLKRFDI